jgi:hypothetical protein
MLKGLMEKPITSLDRYELHAEASNFFVLSLSCHVDREVVVSEGNIQEQKL